MNKLIYGLGSFYYTKEAINNYTYKAEQVLIYSPKLNLALRSESSYGGCRLIIDLFNREEDCSLEVLSDPKITTEEELISWLKNEESKHYSESKEINVPVVDTPILEL